ncbi:MAG TPA: DUF1592 domain-containing protein, partial [Chthoniobacteraceae bacterium]|nr:DUF1592 domain-containing protein [Chthoniobacteraceae bacterium]
MHQPPSSPPLAGLGTAVIAPLERGRLLRFTAMSAVSIAALFTIMSMGSSCVAQDFDAEIRPLLAEYCNQCHSTEKQKGDLDLERFTTADGVKRDPQVWQLVAEQLELGEMPPKDKPQMKPAERTRLVSWVQGALAEMAREHAGDPGPVVLRRLSNSEYTHTVRDLTGVASLDPAREFPVDGAAGEGFTNAGAALVMSPALLAKYLEAAKEIARHAVLLPDGMRFSAHTSERDRTEEALAAIRSFYARFTTAGTGAAVNLQGVKFDTNAGGVLPVEQYLTATLVDREALASGAKSVAAVASERGLNAKYLGALWSVLNQPERSLLLDPVRAQWRSAKAGDAVAIAAAIAPWQKALWRFTTVGHIGKRDGPKAWQVPVTPLVSASEVRLKIPPPAEGRDVTLYLAASDAGDGNVNDFAVWENPRLVAPGRPDLPLREVRAVVNATAAVREKLYSSAARSLAAAEELGSSPEKEAVPRVAQKHGLEPAVLTAWLECLGIGGGSVRIDSHLTAKTVGAAGFDFITGWTGTDALSVIANSSDQHVRVPGNVKPHSVAVHPSPKRRVVIGWRSPAAARMRIEGVVQHAHPECGNGVMWVLELRRGKTRQRLANGTAQGAGAVKIGPIENLGVETGDVLSVVIGPRDGDHSCDLTSVDFKLSDGAREWDLAQDVSPNILAGNPHPDRFGNGDAWHFYSEPEKDTGAETTLPAGSLLAKWQASANAEEKRQLAEKVQALLLSGGIGLVTDAPDALLYRQLTSWSGPLISAVRSDLRQSEAVSEMNSSYGLDPALFGRHPSGAAIDARSLGVQAPSMIEVRLPAELVEGCELVTTAALHRETGTEGTVQMQVLTSRPAAIKTGAIPGLPIIASEGSAARERAEAAVDEFRQLFPGALCYSKIVPVDEVVTLTLFHREDEHLRRLMLDEAQAAELDRLWAELRYVSRDALKLVDVFEQLWQFATQDGDPTVFEPMRGPIRERAAEFQKQLAETEPAHLDGVLRFADTAWRRPLTASEKDGLRQLYRSLRAQEMPHDEALRLTLARVFVAPAFLYKLEAPRPGTEQAPVNDFELASRLSYFLWSSAPDGALLALAAEGKLREPEVLVAQMRRMLADRRVRRLAVEFGTQWLHVRDFDKHDEKSERLFPTFHELRGAMSEEPVLFFTDLFQHDRSVLSLLDADHTFVNAALAQHYTFPGISGEEWRRVEGIRAKGRGGILGFAATLAKQSGASRTSPILRGAWLSETLL